MPTACAEIFPHLSAVVDGEASPPERTRVRTHLAGCEACTTRLQRLEAVRIEVADALQAPPPTQFAARTARLVLERAARPGPLDVVRGWARSLVSDRSASPATGALRWGSSLALARVAVGGLSLAGVMGMSVACSLGEACMVKHRWIAFSGAAWDETLTWLRVLPTFGSGTMFWLVAVACLIVLGGSVALLRVPAMMRDLRAGRDIAVGDAAPAFVGLLPCGFLALVPVLVHLFLQADLLYIDYRFMALNGLAAVLCVSAAWSLGVSVVACLMLLRRCVCGVPAAVVCFAACLAAGGGSEYLLRMFQEGVQARAVSPAVQGALLQGDAIENVIAAVALLARSVLSPSQLVGEVLGSIMAMGFVVGAVLAGLSYAPGAGNRRRVFAVVAGLAVAGGWGIHLAWAHGVTRELGSLPKVMAPRAATADIPRTVFVLVGSEKDPRTVRSVKYPVPGELQAAFQDPLFVKDTGGRFTWMSEWRSGVATARAQLDWDAPTLEALCLQAVNTTPGAMSYAPLLILAGGSHNAMNRWVTNGERSARHMGPRCESRLTRMRPVHLGGIPTNDQHDGPPTGVVRGRLMLDGRPLANVPIRLRTDYWGSEALAPSAQQGYYATMLINGVCNAYTGDVRNGRMQAFEPTNRWSRDTICATRTGADGSFAFDELRPAWYLLAIMLPADVAEPGRLQAERLPNIVAVKEGHTMDVGTVRLERKVK